MVLYIVSMVDGTLFSPLKSGFWILYLKTAYAIFTKKEQDNVYITLLTTDTLLSLWCNFTDKIGTCVFYSVGQNCLLLTNISIKCACITTNLQLQSFDKIVMPADTFVVISNMFDVVMTHMGKRSPSWFYHVKFLWIYLSY